MIELASNRLLRICKRKIPLRKVAAATCVSTIGLILWIFIAVLLRHHSAADVRNSLNLESGLQYALTAASFVGAGIYAYLYIARRAACPFCSTSFTMHKSARMTTCVFHEWRVVEDGVDMLKLFRTNESWQPYKCESCGRETIRRRAQVTGVGISIPLTAEFGLLSASAEGMGGRRCSSLSPTTAFLDG